MSTKTAAVLTDLPAPEPQPLVIRAEIRGRVYTFTELEISEYNRLLQQATSQEDDPDGGPAIDVVDNALLMRLMIAKSVTPKPSPDVLSASGTRLYRAFAKIVNELHYGDEPIKILDEDAPVDDDSAKENPSGND